MFAFAKRAAALTINDRAASLGFHFPAKTGHFAALGRAAADLQVHIRLRWVRGWCRQVALSQEMQTTHKSAITSGCGLPLATSTPGCAAATDHGRIQWCIAARTGLSATVVYMKIMLKITAVPTSLAKIANG